MGLVSDISLNNECSRDTKASTGSAAFPKAATTATTETTHSVAMDSATDGVGFNNQSDGSPTHALSARLNRRVGHGAVLYAAGGAASTETQNKNG